MKASPPFFSSTACAEKTTGTLPLGLAGILLSAALFCSLPAVQAAGTWDGGGGDNNFATAANWVGDVAPSSTPYAGIVMSGNTNTSPTFTSNATFNGANALLFDATTTAAFTFSGSALTLDGGGILLLGPSQTRDLDLRRPLAITLSRVGLFSRDLALDQI